MLNAFFVSNDEVIKSDETPDLVHHLRAVPWDLCHQVSLKGKMHNSRRRPQMLKVLQIRDQVVMQIEDFEAPQLREAL
jgi:hypothetical protein